MISKYDFISYIKCALVWGVRKQEGTPTTFENTDRVFMDGTRTDYGVICGVNMFILVGFNIMLRSIFLV